MLRWLFSLLLGVDCGSCIDPNGKCQRPGSMIDPDG